MLYDLNVLWYPNQSHTDLERTITFTSTLGYGVLALNHTPTLPLPSQPTNPIPTTFPFSLPAKIVLLRRCTIPISDPSQNHRLATLASSYDILALRPTTEKAFLSACTSLTDHSIISLDLTQRFPFPLKPKPFMTAVNRGIRFEICYAQALIEDSGSTARRNFISNCMGIVRATKGRGLIISSEARSALGVRGPADVANLLAVWGLGRERALEALSVNPRAVVINEGLKRNSFRGVIEIVDGGERNEPREKVTGSTAVLSTARSGDSGRRKRKSEDLQATDGGIPKISNRQQKKMRTEAKQIQTVNQTLALEGVKLEIGAGIATDPTKSQ